MTSLRESIQGAVRSLDEGIGSALVRLVLCVALGAVLFGTYAWSRFGGLDNALAMDVAQVARNVSAGQGFVSDCLRPADIGFLEQQGKLPDTTRALPDMRHAPVWPSLLALGFRLARPAFDVQDAPTALFAPEKVVIVPLGILLCIGTGLMVFLLGQTLFDRRSAVVALLLLFLNPAFLASALSGTYLPAAMFFATAAIACALLALRSANRNVAWSLCTGQAALCGLCCAAAGLTSYSLLILPPILLFWFRSGFTAKRWLAASGMVLVFVVAVLPWVTRNLDVSGQPLGMAPYAAVEQSLLHPGDTFDRHIEPTLHNVRVAQAVKTKFRTNVRDVFLRGFGLPLAGIMAAFFLVALFDRFDNEDAERFKWYVLFGLLLLATVFCLRGPAGPDLLQVFLPLVILVGTGYFFGTADRVTAYQAELGRLFAIVVIGVTAVPFFLTLLGPHASIPYPPYYPPLHAYAGRAVPDDTILCTDIPEATAWYGKRRSLLLPDTVDEFEALLQRGLVCRGLYLTSYSGEGARSKDEAWQEILAGRVPPAFPFTEGVHLPPGTKDQLLLTPPPTD